MDEFTKEQERKIVNIVLAYWFIVVLLFWFFFPWEQIGWFVATPLLFIAILFFRILQSIGILIAISSIKSEIYELVIFFLILFALMIIVFNVLPAE